MLALGFCLAAVMLSADASQPVVSLHFASFAQKLVLVKGKDRCLVKGKPVLAKGNQAQYQNLAGDLFSLTLYCIQLHCICIVQRLRLNTWHLGGYKEK